MAILNWSFLIIITSVHARLNAALLPTANQGLIAVLSFQSTRPLGSTLHHGVSLEHSNTEVVPREVLSEDSEPGARNDEYKELYPHLFSSPFSSLDSTFIECNIPLVL